MSLADWAELTPAELNACVRERNRLRMDEQELTQRNIYSLSSLIRAMVWAKIPPSYEDAYNSRVDMTDEQMYAKVRALNALFGGEEVD